jgi:signal transduction histidine kinase
LFLVGVALLFVTVQWMVLDTLDRELRSTVLLRVDTLLEDKEVSTAPDLAGSVDDAAERHAGAYTILQSPADVRLAGNLPPQHPFSGWRKIVVPQMRSTPRQDSLTLLAFGARLKDGGFLLVGQDAGSLEELPELIGRAFLIGGVITSLMAVSAGFLFSRRILRRLAAVGRAGQRVMGGDLSQRLPRRETGDEFDQMVDGFNAMLDRIAELMETVGQVTNDIAHDLRTPLTRLRSRLEDVRRRPRDAADYEAAIDRSIIETDGLLSVFSALLSIAQIGATPQPGLLPILALRPLLDIVVELYLPLTEEREQYLSVAATDDALAVRGDRELLLQMFANLVENATRHTPRGSHINIWRQRVPRPRSGLDRG